MFVLHGSLARPTETVRRETGHTRVNPRRASDRRVAVRQHDTGGGECKKRNRPQSQTHDKNNTQHTTRTTQTHDKNNTTNDDTKNHPSHLTTIEGTGKGVNP